MARQGLLDRSGNLIGTIEIRSDGKQEGRDRSGNLKGTYDPKSNETRDRSGNVVGKGNFLSNLIVGL
jgi:hypothetical protein